jgi:hypothetical protein
MESIEEQIKEILSWFLYQKNVRRADNDRIKIYWVGDNLVRIDIRMEEENGSIA